MSKKFLKIDGDDIKRSSFLVNNSLALCSGSDLLSDIFTKYEVPEEYQKVFFYRNFLNDRIKEFFTDISFDLKEIKKGGVKAILNKRDSAEKLDFHIYLINSNEVNCSKEDIMDYYLTLYNNGCLKGYLSALNDYFLLNMDLDYILELSEGNESLAKQKKLYRQKMSERKTQK